MKNIDKPHYDMYEPAGLCVVIPHYNSPQCLSKALDSLASQQNVNMQVLVIDDASELSCEDIVQEHQRQGLKITLHEMPQKTGTLGCRLEGMKYAEAAYLAFMDADDLLNGPDAYAEALHSAKDNPDIIHFNTLSETKWGFYSFDDYMAPISDHRLKKPEIFSRWLESGCKAHTVWNKFYSKRLYKSVINAKHEIKINRIEDFYLNAWFFLLARSYQPVGRPVYKYHPPKEGSLAKSAARALDCLRMYLEMPSIFAEYSLSEEQCKKLRDFLRVLVTVNGAKMCEYLVSSSGGGEPDEAKLKEILQFGTEDELLLALAVANGSNANKLRDISHILRYSW